MYDPTPCCVRLGADLRNRSVALNVMSRRIPADYAYSDALGAASGSWCDSPARFIGPGGVYAYNVDIGGRLFHVPALFVEEVK